MKRTLYYDAQDMLNIKQKIIENKYFKNESNKEEEKIKFKIYKEEDKKKLKI